MLLTPLSLVSLESCGDMKNGNSTGTAPLSTFIFPLLLNSFADYWLRSAMSSSAAVLQLWNKGMKSKPKNDERSWLVLSDDV